MKDAWKLNYPSVRHIHDGDRCLTYGDACAEDLKRPVVPFTQIVVGWRS